MSTIPPEYLYDSDDEVANPAEGTSTTSFSYQILSNIEPQPEKQSFEFDYYEHIILPSDTLQGICLQYKTTPTKLRQTNRFSGSNLFLAPKKLIIPKSKRENVRIKTQDRTTEEFMIHFLMATFEFINYKEARSYLKIFDWNVEIAMRGIQDDVAWEKENDICRNSNLGISHIRLHCRRKRLNKYGKKNEFEDEREPLLELSSDDPVELPFGMKLKDKNGETQWVMHNINRTDKICNSPVGIEMKKMKVAHPFIRNTPTIVTFPL